MRWTLGTIILGLSLAACGGTTSTTTADAALTSVDGSSTSVTYSGQIKAILDSYCTICHSSSYAAGGIALDSYSAARPVASIANNAIQSGVMPQGESLPSQDKALVQQWINAGTP